MSLDSRHAAPAQPAAHPTSSPLGSFLRLRELPVILALVLLVAVTAAVNPLFLSEQGVKDLLLNATILMILAVGQTLVIITRNIDLSVGSMSGLASAILGVFWVKMGLPAPLAILIALAAGAFMGFVYATLLNRFGMPSFVSTLSGLLAMLDKAPTEPGAGGPLLDGLFRAWALMGMNVFLGLRFGVWSSQPPERVAEEINAMLSDGLRR